jgi:inorganic pyrophosphatase
MSSHPLRGASTDPREKPRVEAHGPQRLACGKERLSKPMDDSISASDDETLICRVEIPKGSRNKYEYDPELGAIKFDRLLMSAAMYPTDYGYLRGTTAGDGDPLDALVCLTEPTFPGCLIAVQPLGLFVMSDEAGPDNKVICVALHDPYWNRYEEVDQLPELLRQEIEQFFSIYKALEPGKTVTVGGWRSREEAEREIAERRRRAADAREVVREQPSE